MAPKPNPVEVGFIFPDGTPVKDAYEVVREGMEERLRGEFEREKEKLVRQEVEKRLADLGLGSGDGTDDG